MTADRRYVLVDVGALKKLTTAVHDAYDDTVPDTPIAKAVREFAASIAASPPPGEDEALVERLALVLFAMARDEYGQGWVNLETGKLGEPLSFGDPEKHRAAWDGLDEGIKRATWRPRARAILASLDGSGG